MKKLTLTERFERIELQTEGLSTRQGTKVPVVILADTSGSMNNVNKNGKRKIDSLNEGLVEYFKNMLEDGTVQDHIDIAIIEFGYNEVELAVDFEHLKKQKVPVFRAGGGTPMCAAVTLGLDILEAQLEIYQSSGIPFHPPHLITMTDGIPSQSGKYDENNVAINLTQTDEEFIRTKEIFDKFKKDYNLVAISVGIGDDIGTPEFLEAFASKPSNVLKLDDHNIVEFFKLVSRSTAILSRSFPSVENAMDFDKVDSKGIVRLFNS
jgi:uncharacterized protein YegL